MNKKLVQRYIRGWKEVEKIEAMELRKMPIFEKARQFLTLAASVHLFTSYSNRLAESKLIQKRWQLLRRRAQGVR